MEEAGRATATGPAASGHLAEGRSGQWALICSMFAQAPEQRLAGLRRAAEFFGPPGVLGRRQVGGSATRDEAGFEPSEGYVPIRPGVRSSQGGGRPKGGDRW